MSVVGVVPFELGRVGELATIGNARCTGARRRELTGVGLWALDEEPSMNGVRGNAQATFLRGLSTAHCCR